MAVRQMIMRACSVTLFAVAGAAFANACTTCAKSIELTKKQLACLELFLPGYLAEATDPVIVSLIACSKKAAFEASRGAHSDPVLKPIVDPNGDNQASEKVYFLTKKQIVCLRNKMGDLKKQSGPQIVFKFSNCKA